MSKKWVISLGGSRIVPGDIDEKFLIKFKDLIDSHPTHKFVVVTGGGITARKYISALKRLGKSTKKQSIEGIAITRFHAGFLARFFGKSANEDIPRDMIDVKNLLEKNHVVFCGGLRWRENNTSDGTAAKLAGFLECPFINLTNVQGLYSDDPDKNPKAKFISKISFNDFYKMTKKIKFEAGQHFVLDQTAAEEIKKKKIKTYIVGSLSAIDNIIKNKKFMGTVIE